MKLQKSKIAMVLCLGLAAGSAFAGSDTTFDDINTKLTDWSTGSLGKTLSLAAFVVGIGAGIMRQSLMAAVVGVGSALIMNYGPDVIGASLSALI